MQAYRNNSSEEQRRQAIEKAWEILEKKFLSYELSRHWIKNQIFFLEFTRVMALVRRMYCVNVSKRESSAI